MNAAAPNVSPARLSQPAPVARFQKAERIEVRYDLVEFDDDNTMVIRAGSRDTAYEIVIVRLSQFPIHTNEWVVALVNLDRTVWSLPCLAGWHPEYLAGHMAGRIKMNPVTAATVAQILDDVAAEWDR